MYMYTPFWLKIDNMDQMYNSGTEPILLILSQTT